MGDGFIRRGHMTETDGQTYIRFLNENDQDALRIIFEKYRNGVTLFLLGIVQNEDDAEELMMDTFAILASRTVRYKVKEDASFKTWLYAIAKNQARTFLRKKRNHFTEPDDDIETIKADDSSLPDSILLENERNAMLYKALFNIDESYRQVLYLMYFEELKPEQISRVIKKSTKQTYNLTTRGRAALRKEMERMGYSWVI